MRIDISSILYIKLSITFAFFIRDTASFIFLILIWVASLSIDTLTQVDSVSSLDDGSSAIGLCPESESKY